MKTFWGLVVITTLITFIFLNSNSLAGAIPRISIQGAKATEIFNTLVKAGAPTQRTDYFDFLSIKKMECTEITNELEKTYSCTTKDYQNKINQISAAAATTLFKIFSNSGAVLHPIDRKTSFELNAIDCVQWNVEQEPNDELTVPTCLFRNF